MSPNNPPTTRPHPLPPPAGSVAPPFDAIAHVRAIGIDEAPSDEVVVVHRAISEAGDQLAWLNDGSYEDEKRLIQYPPPIPNPPSNNTSVGISAGNGCRCQHPPTTSLVVFVVVTTTALTSSLRGLHRPPVITYHPYMMVQP